MCDKEKIRYVHVLTHPSVPGKLLVGRVCGGKMTGDLEDVEHHERQLKNAAAARRRALTAAREKAERERTAALLRRADERNLILRAMHEPRVGFDVPLVLKAKRAWTHNEEAWKDDQRTFEGIRCGTARTLDNRYRGWVLIPGGKRAWTTSAYPTVRVARFGLYEAVAWEVRKGPRPPPVP
jgi:hypothetical protein